jgi:hypothetical protein
MFLTIASLQGSYCNCNKKPDESVPYEQQSSAVCCFTLSTSLTRFATVFSRRFILQYYFLSCPEPDEMVSDEQQSSPVCCFNLSISLTRFTVFSGGLSSSQFTRLKLSVIVLVLRCESCCRHSWTRIGPTTTQMAWYRAIYIRRRAFNWCRAAQIIHVRVM